MATVFRKGRIYYEAVTLDRFILNIYKSKLSQGKKKWTNKMIANFLKDYDKFVSPETVRRHLKKFRDDKQFRKVLEYFDSIPVNKRKPFLNNDQANLMVKKLVFHYWGKRKFPSLVERGIDKRDTHDLLNSIKAKSITGHID